MPFGRKNKENKSSKVDKKQKNMEVLEVITSPNKRNTQECGKDNSKSKCTC